MCTHLSQAEAGDAQLGVMLLLSKPVMTGNENTAAHNLPAQMAPAVGAFALATKLVGYLYRRAADVHGHCYGHHCFGCASLYVDHDQGLTHSFLT